MKATKKASPKASTKKASTKKASTKKASTKKASTKKAPAKKAFDDDVPAFGDLGLLTHQVAALWRQLPRAKLRAGIDDDHDGFNTLDCALDNHFLPNDLQASLRVGDGEEGVGSVVTGLQLLSFDEILAFELAAHGPLMSDVVRRAVAAAAELNGVWGSKRRTRDARVRSLGPDLSLTFAVGQGGRRLLVDLDPGEDGATGQVVEVLPSGALAWRAPSYLAWLQGVAGAADGVG